eukprot:CAMPEP_0176198822 /NCGR_PEP_ID=MMETSP0121_2-20121125/8247_1 /TAXON_ID=160619 /ORGANISM="Kryptoperidinium foliaceum, Strain CCMP 1326" /LENGTH=662 /DNA_ID=CAMNT_0017537677 /DNA_START=79 /DNA_END=2067 /DNA_ORIENTATION=+
MALSVAEAAAFATVSRAAAVAVTPTQQVITMLTEMQTKGDKMMEDERKTYAVYAEWVDDESKRLSFEIQDGQKRIDELLAFIAKADSDVERLGREIGELNAEIDRLEGEKSKATQTRKEEHEEYVKVSMDYSESVDALARAVQVVSAQNFDRPQAEMLLQQMSGSVPGMPRVLAAMLQEKSRRLRGRSSGSDLEPGAPEVAAYDSQSGGVLALLESLHKKFKAELAAVEEDEANQAHEFALVELHLSDTITKDTADREEKAVAKGERAAASAKARGELGETRKEKAADEKLFAEIKATFAVKTSAYEQNQAVRKQELEAIAKAVEIISSPAVAGSYAKHINLAQRPGASFIQTAMSRSTNEALQLLRSRASALKSTVLAAAAAQLQANPSFAKVIDMIEDLLEKLKAEAAAEAEHHAWCEEQLKANKLKRNKKTAEANKLTAAIDGLSADIADMGANIERLAAEQQQLTAAMAEATKIRESEHAENTEAIADAAAGVEAVKSALVVLKEFYASQASLLQQRQVPEMAEYKGMQSAKGGVVGMLEVIQSDFSRLKAETESAEATAASEYKDFMDKSTASKKAKHDEEFKLKLDKDQAEFEREQTEKDLRTTEAELEQANKYFESLKPACLEVPVNWEEREAKRKEEVAALKEAWEILDRKSKE